MKRIYLDHAATSPVAAEVVEAMRPFYEGVFGNPSSIHHFGREARRGLDEARDTIAGAVNAGFDEIIFTSGGTESDNLAVIGYSMANREKGRHVITTQVEHHGILHAFEHLETLGFEVTYLQVDESGRVSEDQVRDALREDTILISIMYGNNEVGTVQPVEEIGAILTDHQAVFHTDAVQAFGLAEIDVKKLNVDMLSVSAHKINGPKGTGFLYLKSGLTVSPGLYGGEQERKRRAGTENVAGAAGLKKAVELAIEKREERLALYDSFRTAMIQVFDEEGLDFQVNGSSMYYLPHILNVSFPGANVELMLTNLDISGIAASSGSACTAGSIEPSHVLSAMFPEQPERSRSAIRFSFGDGLTEEDIRTAAEKTAKIVTRLTD
ncbi:cysteine desulfurase family protein [Alteribacter natronophilus]|uniref:cysteine desulfurase family protein n=1 Tax=Alteribacter natronophilus TaxID=2583810 RepID=UPI00110E1519|nr:cysteine desulfurase family protein [Alteribacter natronophilus]TMW73955.1 cysteine desulfurase [Alteribacter natronophilus]